MGIKGRSGRTDVVDEVVDDWRIPTGPATSDDVAVWSTDTSRDVAVWSTDTSRDVAVWRTADGDAGLAVRSTNAVPGRSTANGIAIRSTDAVTGRISTNGIAIRIATDELVQRVVDTFSHADSSRSVFFFWCYVHTSLLASSHGEIVRGADAPSFSAPLTVVASCF